MATDSDSTRTYKFFSIGFEVGTNSCRKAHPFDERKTGKQARSHRLCCLLPQVWSFCTLPYKNVLSKFIVQEHFQKLRIESAMSSSEPTAKQVICNLKFSLTYWSNAWLLMGFNLNIWFGVLMALVFLALSHAVLNFLLMFKSQYLTCS